MKKFNLGIIGRCLSCQPWINPSDLYHRQLKRKLLEKDNIIMKIIIASNSQLEPQIRLKNLYKKKQINAVLYSIRLIEHQPILFSNKDKFGKYTYKLHPNFYKRFLLKNKISYNGIKAIDVNNHWWKEEDEHENFLEIPKRKLFNIPLHNINLFIAKLCNINSLEIAKELYFFEKLYKECLNFKIPLFILGPISSIEIYNNKSKFIFFKKYQKAIQKQVLKYKVPNFFFNSYLNEKNEKKESLYKKDKYHLNSKGHTFLAEELYPIFSSWIKSNFNFFQNF
jgi:hypothetical protein